VATIAVTETYQPPGGREHRPGRPPLVRTAADPADLALVRDDVARLRERAGTVVVSMHWGLPGNEIADYQREIARAAVDAGADVVVGHGPHVVHGVEIHRGKPILYSLGNTVFDQPVAGARGAGALAVLDLDQGRLALHLVPAGTDRRVLPPLDPAARPLADRVRALSALLGTTVEDAHDHLRIELS
jgi:poly-gamma-glutamate synthesis protein (capsule biosynthesis protein)